MNISTSHNAEIDAATLAAVSHLACHSDFRVLRRIGDTKWLANDPVDHGPTRIAVVDAMLAARRPLHGGFEMIILQPWRACRQPP